MVKEENTANFRTNAAAAGAKGPTYTGNKSKASKMASKSNKKWVRLATVLAYVLSVSLAAIVLAIYYSLMWNPKIKENTSTTATSSPTVTTPENVTASAGETAAGYNSSGESPAQWPRNLMHHCTHNQQVSCLLSLLFVYLLNILALIASQLEVELEP